MRRGPRNHSFTGTSTLRSACAAVCLLACSAYGFAQDPAAPTPSDPQPVTRNQFQTLMPGDYLGYNQRVSLIQRGKIVYDRHCVGCHGIHGDGNGPAAARLITKPRDFTSGIYKFRSTDSGSLPLERDLHRTLSRGLARVSMPAFPLMPERDMLSVIEYIKSFYPDWERQKSQRVVVPVPSAPRDLNSEKRIRRGRVVYFAMQCGKCHGSDGAGSGATQTEYVDAWGNPQKPFNFNRGSLKGGDDPADIYRTFHTGLRSIMPSYGGDTLATVNRATFESQKQALSAAELAELEPALAAFPASGSDVFKTMSAAERAELAERNSWDLVAYILSLRRASTTAGAVLGATP